MPMLYARDWTPGPYSSPCQPTSPTTCPAPSTTRSIPCSGESRPFSANVARARPGVRWPKKLKTSVSGSAQRSKYGRSDSRSGRNVTGDTTTHATGVRALGTGPHPRRDRGRREQRSADPGSRQPHDRAPVEVGELETDERGRSVRGLQPEGGPLVEQRTNEHSRGVRRALRRREGSLSPAQVGAGGVAVRPEPAGELLGFDPDVRDELRRHRSGLHHADGDADRGGDGRESLEEALDGELG